MYDAIGEQKKRRYKYRAEKRCYYCGRQDGRTLRGLLYCGECAEKKKRHRNSTPRDDKEYVVYDKDDNYLFGGVKSECIKFLGITDNNFCGIVHRTKKKPYRKVKSYSIVEVEEDVC